jgi:hypothetical protein
MVGGEKNSGRHATSENSKLHVWITFQARFKIKPITYEAILDHVWITFQERICCVTQFQNSCADHNIEQFWSVFGSHFKKKLITYEAILEHVWITFSARFKNQHALLPSFKIDGPITFKAISFTYRAKTVRWQRRAAHVEIAKGGLEGGCPNGHRLIY